MIRLFSFYAFCFYLVTVAWRLCSFHLFPTVGAACCCSMKIKWKSLGIAVVVVVVGVGVMLLLL